MHYYKRNLGDYYKKAGRLTMLQHGACTLLIDSCYDREEFPTLDMALDWCWASDDAEVAAVKFVLSKLFRDEDGVFIQDQIKNDIDKYHQNAETNKRIALEREAKRRVNSTNRAPSVNEPTPNQEPRTNKPKNQEPNNISEQVQKIFTYWQQVMDKPKSKLTKERSSKIEARLKDYSPDDICQAIENCSRSKFNMGDNDNKKEYNDIELICRNGVKLESFRDMKNAY